MGSLAYGLPTEAVYRRSYRHIYVRDQYECINDDLLTSFSLKHVDQMMMFADQWFVRLNNQNSNDLHAVCIVFYHDY